MIFHRSIDVKTSKRLEVLDITDRINDLLMTMRVETGLVNLWTVHTTAALTVNENDRRLWTDLINTFTKIAPIESDYHHRPNAHAHILSSVVKPDITIPVSDGGMALGTWQRILLLELDGPRRRLIKITVIGEQKVSAFEVV